MKNNEFYLYKTREDKIAYVAWLLACDAGQNIAKGERLLNELPDDKARNESQVQALNLREFYSEG